MPATELLEQLEAQPHAQRVRTMLDLAKQADGTAVIAALAQGGPYERYLALHSVYITRDQALLAQFLHDQSQLVRKTAIHLACLFADDRLLLETLQRFNLPDRETLLLALRRAKRFAVIDEFVSLLDASQAILYARFASPKLITQIEGEVFERMNLSEWRRMARWHPQYTLHCVRDWLAHDPKLEYYQLQRLDLVLNQLIEVQPQIALNALDATLPYLKLPLDPKGRRRYWCYFGPRLNLSKFLHFQGSASIELLRKHQPSAEFLRFGKYHGAVQPELLLQLRELGLLSEEQAAELHQVQASAPVPDLPQDGPSLHMQLLQTTPDHIRANEMLKLLLRQDRQAFATLAPKLLQQDPLWLEQPVLLHYLERQQPALLLQSLLAFPLERLKQLQFAGSFATWSQQQQSTLYKYLTQAQLTGKALRQAMTMISKLYAVEPRFLLDFPYAEGMYQDLFEHDIPYLWAMQALRRVDTPAALPIIRQSLTNLYTPLSLAAFEQQLLRRSPSEVLAILSDFPTEQGKLVLDWFDSSEPAASHATLVAVVRRVFRRL